MDKKVKIYIFNIGMYSVIPFLQNNHFHLMRSKLCLQHKRSIRISFADFIGGLGCLAQVTQIIRPYFIRRAALQPFVIGRACFTADTPPLLPVAARMQPGQCQRDMQAPVRTEHLVGIIRVAQFFISVPVQCVIVTDLLIKVK